MATAPRLRPRITIPARSASAHLTARRPALLTLWQWLTWPLWFGSETPRPATLPRRAVPEADAPDRTAPETFLYRQLGRLQYRFWASWLISSVIRGTAIGLTPSLVILLAAHAGLTTPPGLLFVVISAVVGAAIGGAFGMTTRPSRSRLAAMLDQTFSLAERLTTAISPQWTSDHLRVRRAQHADAANALIEVSPELPRPWLSPLREAILLTIIAAGVIVAWFTWIPSSTLPDPSPSNVPAFVPAGERLLEDQEARDAEAEAAAAPDVDEVQHQSLASNTARNDLSQIGAALDGNQLTQGAADAIADGDYAAAAESLRASAAEASSTSPDVRNALAEDLEEAAEGISEENQPLADASQAAADDLRESTTEGSELGTLADEIERTGGDVIPQDELASELREGASSQEAAPQQGAETNGIISGQDAPTDDPSDQPTESEDPVADQQPAEIGDPGEGLEAGAGIGEEGEGSGEGSAEGTQAGSTGGEQSGQASGQQTASERSPSDGDSDSATGDISAASGGPPPDSPAVDAPGDASDMSDQGDDIDMEDASRTGGGASGAETAEERDPADESATEDTSQDEETSSEDDMASEGRAVDDPPPGGPESDGGDDAPEPETSGGSESLTLEGTSEDGVRTGDEIGSASLGSGSGAGAAGGDAEQQPIDRAGPDSNRVPDDLRDIVEEFFTGWER